MTGQAGIKGLGLDLSQNNLRVIGNDSDNFGQETLGGAGYTFPNPAPTPAFDSDQWAHWALTGVYDAGSGDYTVRVYLNGTLIDWNGAVGTSFTVAGDIIDNDGDLTIGSFFRDDSWAHQRFISGGMTPDGSTIPGEAWIDDFAMWDVALDPDDVADLAGGVSPLHVGGVSNLNAPVAEDATFAFSEGSPMGAAVGTVAASDADAGSVLTYAVTDGNGAGLFAIDPANGLITVAAPLDYETASQHVLTVTVADNGVPQLSESAEITVNVLNVLEDNAEVVADALTGAGGPFAGQSDPGVIGFGANPDADSWVNALEVLFGFDPGTSNGGEPIRTRFVEVEGETYLEALIEVAAVMDDLLTWRVEWSSDLKAWAESGQPHVLVTETAGVRTVSIRDHQTVGNSRGRYVRVKIVGGE